MNAQGTPSGSAPRSTAPAVLFALGMAQVPPEAPLPGPALIALLADMGISEGAARSAILRMRRQGSLVSQRVGRVASYAPSPAVLAGHHRRAQQYGQPAPAWGGNFHALLISVPESRRSFRDELRRATTLAGYRSLQAGVMIAASDRTEELGPLLERLPPGAAVLRARLSLSGEDSRHAAAGLWGLAELAERFRGLAEVARGASHEASHNPPEGPAAVRALASATLAIYEAFADDPGLPGELLPADWPGEELRAALGQALRTIFPAVAAHVALLREQYRRPVPCPITRTS